MSTTMQESTAASIGNFISGEVVQVAGVDHLPIYNPSTGATLGSVPMSRADAVDAAVKAAQGPQREWANVGLKDRVQVMYRLKAIVEDRLDELAELVTSENGKTIGESKGELLRGVECIEFAASLPQIAAGQVMEVSRGVECKMLRYPLGVVASITPFNFPFMVPLWTVPVALSLGNALVLKPSEQTPLSAMKLAELLEEAGLPKGLISVVNGGRDVVEAICDHPGITGVSFVGSTRVAKAVYERCASHNKRCKALGGAKNHLVVMPDADPDMTAANVVASATGCAGQRCMAASVLLAVKGSESIVDNIKERFSAMKAGKDIGAIISTDAKERITGYIDRCTSKGAELAVDGRGHIDASAPADGNYIGPTLFDNAQPDHEVSCDEIFGPTLTVVRVNTLDDALSIENANPYGNAAAIYTSSGEVANYFTERASAGMIGVNIGVPVPREPFPFGGWNDSSFGEGDLTGHGCFDFWTKTKKVTTKWTDRNRSNWMS